MRLKAATLLGGPGWSRVLRESSFHCPSGSVGATWLIPFLRPPSLDCQIPGTDLEINPTLESLCLSMTEHALGGETRGLPGDGRVFKGVTSQQVPGRLRWGPIPPLDPRPRVGDALTALDRSQTHGACLQWRSCGRTQHAAGVVGSKTLGQDLPLLLAFGGPGKFLVSLL